MADFDRTNGKVRALAERLIRFETTNGNERPAQEWFRDRLADLGFETYSWIADPAALSTHRSFPDEADPSFGDRPSVAGVLECGNPDRGPTLVFNGHMDVVPATADHWTGDPFEPRFANGRLVGRGAADMKSGLAACVLAARRVADEGSGISEGDATDALDGRIVVESVVGEEEGGIGAAAGTLTSPYPFERDAVIVAEPTDLRVVIATEGCLMGRLSIDGRSAHAARRWAGRSVLPAFERVRATLLEFETDRGTHVAHPLYDRFDTPWPVVIGRFEGGTWASNVPGVLTADVRIGVAPGESVAAVEADWRERLAAVAAGSDCTIGFERLGVQFESAEIGSDEPVVGTLRAAMMANDIEQRTPVGETYGADARYYIEAGTPAAVFGPGRIEQAHFPDESIEWADVVTASEVLAETARRYLSTPV